MYAACASATEPSATRCACFCWPVERRFFARAYVDPGARVRTRSLLLLCRLVGGAGAGGGALHVTRDVTHAMMYWANKREEVVGGCVSIALFRRPATPFTCYDDDDVNGIPVRCAPVLAVLRARCLLADDFKKG